MMHFKLWLVENSTRAKNQLATLVQQALGAGDRNAMSAILQMIKEKNDTQLHALKQVISGYVNHEGKAGSAARYLMDTIAELDNESDQQHYGEKAREAINSVAETLGKASIPMDLQDEFMELLEKETSTPDFFMKRHYLGNQFMVKAMPYLVKMAEHLFSRYDEKEAKDHMIEILGDMTMFAEHVPTIQMIMSRLHRGG